MTDEIVAHIRGSRTTRRAPLSLRFAETIATRLRGSRPSRRDFLTSTAVVGSALTVAPLRFVLRPGSAYATLCGPASDCASGWTVFCCTVNNGANTCPPGTIAAGWWKADRNSFCAGEARYYVDCNARCGPCGCGSSGICPPSCWNCSCRCHDDPGTCDHRRHCCNEFRYGNCNQQVACVGPVVCRVVSCRPPWQWEPGCTTVSATANQTAEHTAPCLADLRKDVHAFGSAPELGSSYGRLGARAAAFASMPDGSGYWLASINGGVRAYGAAERYGALDTVTLYKSIVDITATSTGLGYWLVNSNGRIWPFGDAGFYGSTDPMDLVRPIVAMAATPSGEGYWLVNSNGRIFPFGDAGFYGSTDGVRLASPVVDMCATPSGRGYWLATADGRVARFGDAAHYGGLGGEPIANPIVGIAAMPGGGGYLLLDELGRVSPFGSARYRGGLRGSGAEHGGAVAIETTADGDGYWIAAMRPH